MSRLNIFLLIVVLACALAVVNSSNRQREVFIDLQRAQSQERQLQQDDAQLQYQQSALSKTSRVENIATADLKMQAVTSGRTQYLTVDPNTVPADGPVAGDAASDAARSAQAGASGATRAARAARGAPSAQAGSSAGAASSVRAAPSAKQSSGSAGPAGKGAAQ